jgi:uncharacterized 2Fe-2S/4Fe-4S cluster protein (DUF4445 family)
MNKQDEKKCIVRFEPSGLDVEVSEGTVLLDAARRMGVYLSSICGGDGYCGKCKVTVNKGQYESKATTLLSAAELEDKVALACQTKALSDISVTIAHEHALDTGQILIDSDTTTSGTGTEKLKEMAFAYAPLVEKIYLELNPPTVEDHTADHERLKVMLRDHITVRSPILEMDYETLQELPTVLQESDYQVTVTVGAAGGITKVVQVEQGDRTGTNYAVAVDVGTTTVVAHLIDLVNGSTLCTEAVYNSQINYGEDYIRRIIYAEQNDAFDELQRLIIKDINGLLTTLTERNKLQRDDITTMICAGNTAMIHFMLKLDSKRIRREPYVGTANFIPTLKAAEVGIEINRHGLLYCIPSVAAYVGGDIVAGTLATRLNKREGLSLFVDIGTNGEVVLGNSEWLMCASSSAGPAFEGSGVKDGMRACSGAIEKLKITPDGAIDYKTIGHTHPIGICGSGLLDTIAELFTSGIIDRTGRFQVKDDPRLGEGDEGLQYVLVPAENNYKEIVITQADINNLIRSKAGVFAAIKILMESTQTGPQDLDAIYLAGGFGNYLNVEKAVTIGLLPDIAVEKIHFVGNTSIAGAKAALRSRDAQLEAEHIANSMTYSDLMSLPAYMEEFIRANFLPHTDLSLFPSDKISAVSK